MKITLNSLNEEFPVWLISSQGRGYVADRRDVNAPGLIQARTLSRMREALLTYPGPQFDNLVGRFVWPIMNV